MSQENIIIKETMGTKNNFKGNQGKNIKCPIFFYLTETYLHAKIYKLLFRLFSIT